MNLLDLIHPKPPVIPSGLSAEHDLALHALTIAEDYIKAITLEKPGNRGDQIDFFNRLAGVPVGSSYCCAFVYTCFAKAWTLKQGLLNGKTGDENRLIMLAEADTFSHKTGFPRTASCETLRLTLEHQGRLVSHHDVYRIDPPPGSIVFYDFKKQGVAHHVGILVQVAPSTGELIVAEGNTPAGVYGNQADGDGCHFRPRGRESVIAYGVFK
jgi:hypothetical protein